LNQPLKITESALDWTDGRRVARVMRVEGFGGMWAGNIEEKAKADEENGPAWNFHLHVDQLDAADLDRWVGRERAELAPELLPTLLEERRQARRLVNSSAAVNAEGELEISKLTIEKLKLNKLSRRALSVTSNSICAKHKRSGRWQGARQK